MPLPTLKTQEVAFDSPDSCCFFQPSAAKPFLATPAALRLYGEAIPHCLAVIQGLAAIHQGMDYLQVFTDPSKSEPLWLIEDGEGGAITALLPSDY